MKPTVEAAPKDEVLGGIIAAALTPITPDHEIDIDRLVDHVARLRSQGCSHVSLFGSTGEGPSFSTRQKREALADLAHAGVATDRLIPAAMSSAAEDAAAMISTAAARGCRAVLVLPPYYYGSAAADGIAAFFADCVALLGGALPIDVLLYHIPAMSRVGYEPEVVDTLVDRYGDRIVGIKDSTGDAEHTLMLARRFPDLRLFTGDDRVLPALLAAGGAGLIGGMPNLFAADLCRLHADPGAPVAAELLATASRRIAAIEAAGGLIALKALLGEQLGDATWKLPMPPLVPLDESRLNALAAELAGVAPPPNSG